MFEKEIKIDVTSPITLKVVFCKQSPSKTQKNVHIYYICIILT